MKKILIACLIILNICLLLGAMLNYESPSNDYIIATDINVFQPEEDVWVSIPFYIIDPEPGQVLTWTGKEYKWVYIKELLEEEE